MFPHAPRPHMYTRTHPVGTSHVSKTSGAQKHPDWILAQGQEGAQAALSDVCQGQQVARQQRFAASQKPSLVFCHSVSLLKGQGERAVRGSCSGAGKERQALRTVHALLWLSQKRNISKAALAHL